MPHDTPTVEETLQNPENEVNTFPHIRRNPIVLSGVFLEVTRNLYLHRKHLLPNVNPWSPTDEEGHVYIDVAHKWDDDESNRRPAIFIDIGNLEYTYNKVVGMGDVTNFDLRTGTSTHARLVNGSVLWAHIGRNRGETLNYASTTLDLIDGFAPVIQKDFCFDMFRTRAILKPRQRKDEPKEWECIVQADFSFQEVHQLKLEAPKLKQITAVIMAGLNQTFNLVK